jgi:nickel/cobalt exporter
MKQIFLRLKLIGLGFLVWLYTQPAIAHPTHDEPLLQGLIQPEMTLPFMLSGLAIAFLLGASHAFTPGHGKTMMAAYLVGSQGTAQHALILGLATTLTHTVGVFALGLISIFASHYIAPETLYPILTVISGLTVCGVGIALLKNRLLSFHTEDDYDHHGHHSHGHYSDHHEHHHSGHDHTHCPPSETVTFGSLSVLGIAGGLVPCPSALVVLLSAMALHQVTFGLFLTTAFSLGMASVLIAIGIGVVYAKQWLDTLPTAAILPKQFSILSAIAVIVVGVSLTASGIF